MNTGKALLGIMAGVAVGALFGVLYAPDKGCETRKKIARKSKEYVDELSERLNEFMEEVTEKVESISRKVKDTTGSTEPGNISGGI